MENSATTEAIVDLTPKADDPEPAPAADDQKATQPAEGEAPSEQQETPEQQEAKKQSKFQRRLERQKTARIAAETEARLLRERIAELEAKSGTTSKPDDGEPKPENFADFNEYTRALARYEAKQVLESERKSQAQAQQGKEQQAEQHAGMEKVAKAWSEREQSFQAQTKDYEAVVAPFADEELQSLSKQARMAIVESDTGPALLYELAKLAEDNPSEFSRIAGLSPVRQIAELGKLEAKVSQPARKTTNAPAPAATTQGGRTATKDPSKMSQEEYEAYRKSQGARWAR